MDFNHNKNSWYPYGIISKARGIDPDYLQSIKYEFDKHIYYYGDHFQHHYEKINREDLENVPEYLGLLKQINNLLKDHPDWIGYEKRQISNSPIIVSNSYFSWNKHLSDHGYEVRLPIWEDTAVSSEIDALLKNQCFLIKKLFIADFQLLLNREFIEILEDTRIFLKRYYNNPCYIGLIVPYVLPFFEYSTNHIFRQLGKKTFLSIHGLSHGYTEFNASELFEFNADKYFTDYYLVWGEKIAEQFPKHGIPEDKVIITGHPDYIKLPDSELRYDFDSVLVCTRAMSGSAAMNLPIFQNRADLIDYVYRVQTALQEIGVKSARLRPHPCESPEWYWKHIDQNFYSMDILPLKESFRNSSLLIGSTSTVFIDSILNGVNYVLFDPRTDYDQLEHMPYDPPFDGSMPEVPVARTTCELVSLLTKREGIDRKCIDLFIQTPFNIDKITGILESDLISFNHFSNHAEPNSTKETTISEIDSLIINTVRPFHSSNDIGLLTMIKGIEHIQKNSVPGSIVELQPSQAGSMMVASLKLIELNDVSRKIILVDDQDKSNLTLSNILATSYPENKLLSLNSSDESLNADIALIYVDTNTENKSSNLIRSLIERLSKNGIIIFEKMDEKLKDELETISPFNMKFDCIADTVGNTSWYSIKPL